MTQTLAGDDRREPLLAFDIVKRFEGFTLACDAEFESGVTAIFGPSGSGKTTLLNCIAGLVTPTRAEITVGGRTVFSSTTGTNVPPEKRRFGYVFQDSALFPHMSVRDNIEYGHKLTPPDRRRIQPDQLVDLLSLGGLVDRGVENLSGGERQRVALARALAASPDLLLLDEPLSSLDVTFRGVIIQALKRIWEELRMPMVYVSHSISEVLAVAHSALVLSEGRAVARAAPADLAANPDVTTIADYAALENILEAHVTSHPNEEGLTKIALGRAELLAPEVTGRPGDSVMVSIRAADIIVALEVSSRMSARNVFPARIEEIHTVGGRALVYADVGVRIAAEITPGSVRDLKLRNGQEVQFILKSFSIGVHQGSQEIPLDGPPELR